MIKVLEKTDKLLLLATEHAPVSFTEMQNMTGFNKATLSQILKSMVELSWLDRGDDGRFRIGSGIAALADSKSTNVKLRELCRNAAEKLNCDLNELVSVATFTEGERRIITKIEANHLVQVKESTSSAPELMFQTATGLVLLSGLDKNVQTIFAERHKLKSLLTQSEAKIKQITHDGYCELIMGNNDSISMAVGIYDHSGNIIAAIGFSAPCYRFKMGKTEAVEMLKECASQIRNAVI